MSGWWEKGYLDEGEFLLGLDERDADHGDELENVFLALKLPDFKLCHNQIRII